MPAITRSNSSRRVIVSKAAPVERVQMNVEPPQTRVVQSASPAGPAARRWWSEPHRECPSIVTDPLDQTGRSFRTSGSPPVSRDLVHAQAGAALRTNRSISSKLRISSRGPKRHVLRHAVEAPDIAPVRDTDAEVRVQASEGVDEQHPDLL